jgi:hypothetical protein
MSYLIWMVTIVMAAFALTFVVVPLTRERQELRKITLAAALLVPLGAIGMYALIGEPGTTVHASAGSSASRDPGTGTDTQQPGTKVGSVASLVGGLVERLKQQPDDANGWLLLARSYEHLGEMEKAAAAYAKASALGASDEELEASLTAAKSSSGGEAEIHGRVTLDASAMGQVEPTDTVFIFAKAVNGSSMPVAALREPAKDLPFEFVLSDRQSMVDIARLSNFESVVVGARISRSGNAMQDDTGLTVQSDPVKVVGGDFIELIITSAHVADSSY